MENEVFKAGVRPGSPNTNDEIKILVCYILSKTGSAMSFAQIHEVLSEHELVNYFELVSAIDSLEHTHHIGAEQGEGGAPVYAVTELGKSTAETIDGLLPLSVRDKAAVSAAKLLRRKKREREVKVEIAEQDAGFEVMLAIPDSGSNLAAFTVFCPTREEAELIRRRFLNDPFYIYKGTLALLTGDREIMGEIFPSKEKLF